MVTLKPYHGKQIMWKDIYMTYFLSQWQRICLRYFRWCLHAKGGEKWSSSEWKGFVCLNESLGKLEVWRRRRGKCTTCAQGSAVCPLGPGGRAVSIAGGPSFHRNQPPVYIWLFSPLLIICFLQNFNYFSNVSSCPLLTFSLKCRVLWIIFLGSLINLYSYLKQYLIIQV